MDQALLQQTVGLPQEVGRIVVAMSGGVDSSVVAAALAHYGYDVVGITLHLYDQDLSVVKAKSCCASRDVYDAKRVAELKNFPHYVMNATEQFSKDVIDDFASSYAEGKTPVPCIKCNQTVKFTHLLQMAKDLGASALATGHYVDRLVGNDGLSQLHRGVDLSKDQSYFLFGTTQEQLNFLRFPLGRLNKQTTRQWADELGLKVARKPDSQDICFVATGRYTQILERLKPESLLPGPLYHVDGRYLTQHRGVGYYTVGQRRGLDLGGTSETLFVVHINATNRRITVGPKSYLECAQVRLDQVNWLGHAEVYQIEAKIKVRSQQHPIKAHFQRDDSGDGATVFFDEPEFSVAPGQACVVYEGERVLGGGWIKEVYPRESWSHGEA